MLRAVLRLASLAGALALAAPAIAEEPVVQEVLDILKERGLVDESEHARLSAKNQSYEAKEEKFLPTLEFFGDLRARYEGFWFDRDNANVNRDNRHRGRYRLRFGGKTKINDWFGAQFRFASGNDHDSRNQSFGSGDDFDPDPFNIDQAFIRFWPVQNASDYVDGGKVEFQVGKVPNPFRWKIGKDFLWDGDITPEGVALVMSGNLLPNAKIFFNTGYFIIDEESGGQDPHLWAAQLGGEFGVHERVKLGGRVSYYSFHSIDTAFVLRNAGDGNIVDGLTGDPTGEQGIDVVEAGAYAKISAIEDWPILLYGTWAHNTDAEESMLFPEGDTEGTGWNIGFEIGDKKKWVKLGAGYWSWQSNFFPARFVDSDAFDGITNREGWIIYGSRQLARNTDLNFTLFYRSDELEDFRAASVQPTMPNPFIESVRNAERIRLQADLVVKF